ncbi:MAG: hypothetical protein ABI120_03130 [Gemmatimonadaceae bacterium]
MNTTQLVDAIIALVMIEGIGLAVFRLANGRGMPTREVVSFLGAGAGLLVALRVLISDGSFLWFAAAMLVSLVLHLWHVKQRWQ